MATWIIMRTDSLSMLDMDWRIAGSEWWLTAAQMVHSIFWTDPPPSIWIHLEGLVWLRFFKRLAEKGRSHKQFEVQLVSEVLDQLWKLLEENARYECVFSEWICYQGSPKKRFDLGILFISGRVPPFFVWRSLAVFGCDSAQEHLMPPNGDAKGMDPSRYPSGLGFSGSYLDSRKSWKHCQLRGLKANDHCYLFSSKGQ